MELNKLLIKRQKDFIKKSVSFFNDCFYFPFSLLSCLIFTFRRFFFGPSNALNYIKSVDSRSLLIILRCYGARIGRNCDIQQGLTFHNCKNFNNFTVGNNCHIGKNCFFDLRDTITIEDNVVISMCSKLITHIDMSRSSLSSDFPASSGPIVIGNNSYLGVGSTVLMGVEIAPKVLVAANSLVNKSIEKSCKVAGIPARVIGD